MDEEPPRKPSSFVLGGDLDRHSVGELEALAMALEQELTRVRRVIGDRQDIRARAEALFKAAAKAAPEDD